MSRIVFRRANGEVTEIPWQVILVIGLPAGIVGLVYLMARYPAFGQTVANGIASLIGTISRAVSLGGIDIARATADAVRGTAREAASLVGDAGAVAVSPVTGPLYAVGQSIGAVATVTGGQVVDDGDFFAMVNLAQMLALQRGDWGSYFFLQQRGIARDEAAVKSWLRNLGYRFRDEIAEEERRKEEASINESFAEQRAAFRDAERRS